jgi:hypothetical protein
MTLRILTFLAGLVGALSFAGNADGDVVTVLNPGFETAVLGEGTSTATVADWFTFGTPVTVMNPSTVQFPGGATTEGLNAAMLAPAGLLVQNLSSVLQFGTYTVEFDLGNRLDADYAGMQFVFKAGGVGMLPASSLIPTPGDGLFQTATVTFSATPTNVNGGFVGGALRIEFLTPSTGSGFTALDNVRINFTAIPEPSAAGLAGLALVAATVVGRRRR